MGRVGRWRRRRKSLFPLMRKAATLRRGTGDTWQKRRKISIPPPLPFFVAAVKGGGGGGGCAFPNYDFQSGEREASSISERERANEGVY